mmetsp:Transcript_182344/g.443853  ORF Transcript_182344/g.443853 Transcript_182344/m.443853 type:complete len:231 (+) Transcript_182344:312-1004(+)
MAVHAPESLVAVAKHSVAKVALPIHVRLIRCGTLGTLFGWRRRRLDRKVPVASVTSRLNTRSKATFACTAKVASIQIADITVLHIEVKGPRRGREAKKPYIRLRRKGIHSLGRHAARIQNHIHIGRHEGIQGQNAGSRCHHCRFNLTEERAATRLCNVFANMVGVVDLDKSSPSSRAENVHTIGLRTGCNSKPLIVTASSSADGPNQIPMQFTNKFNGHQESGARKGSNS